MPTRCWCWQYPVPGVLRSDLSRASARLDGAVPSSIQYPAKNVSTVLLATGYWLLATGHYPVLRSILYEEPASVLACSFISDATALASHSVVNLRRSLVATPSE